MSGESQYTEHLSQGKYQLQLGSMRAFDWFHDPKRLAFVSSRYKFVSKMLDGFPKVLEIGSGDGHGHFKEKTQSEILVPFKFKELAKYNVT
jgi:hypothetical protein